MPRIPEFDLTISAVGKFNFVADLNIEALVGPNTDVAYSIQLREENGITIVYQRDVAQTRAAAGSFWQGVNFWFDITDPADVGAVYQVWLEELTATGDLTLLSGSFRQVMGPFG